MMKYQNPFYTSILLLFFISLSIQSFGQPGKNKLDREFTWDKTDRSETIQYTVEKGAKKLKMDIKGWISEGKFNLTVYDPEGNKTGWFSLVSSGEGTDHLHIETHEDHSHHTYVDVNGHGSDTNVSVRSTNTSSSDEGGTKKKSKVKTKQKKKADKKKKKGNFTYSMTDNDDKQAKGVMKKTIADPSPGIWKLVFEVEEATGALTAKVYQDQ